MAGSADRRVAGYLGRVLAGDGTPAGTCFQVAPGVLVTAWHVVEEIGAAAEGTLIAVDPLPGGDAFDAVVRRLDAVHDLAVLTTGQPLAEVAGPLAETGRVPKPTTTVISDAARAGPGTARLCHRAGERSRVADHRSFGINGF